MLSKNTLFPRPPLSSIIDRNLADKKNKVYNKTIPIYNAYISKYSDDYRHVWCIKNNTCIPTINTWI